MVMTFLHLKYIMADANFPLVHFSKISMGSVFPITTSLMILGSVSTFMGGHLCMTFLNYSKKCQKNLSK